MEKKILKAVHDQDLEKLLNGLGISDTIKNGEKKCKFCESVIALDNIHAIFPESGDIKIVCDSPICIKRLSVFLNKNKLSS